MTGPVDVFVQYCVPDEQESYVPGRRRAPEVWPPGVPLPRVGEHVYLSSSSAWSVTRVIHEWLGTQELHIELWLEWEGSARVGRPSGFELTQ